MIDEINQAVLLQLNLEAVEHPRLKAQRTLIFKKVDEYVGSRSAAEIKNEILSIQEWAKIRQVIKLGNNTHIFKIEFEDTKITDRILNEGLLLFNMAITPCQIEKDSFTEIMTCFKCYALDSHYTNKCPTPNKVICSECASDTHIFRDCKSNTKKCVNCDGDHKTTSMSCPKRKMIIKAKQNQKKTTETYATILNNGNATTGNSGKTQINIHSKMALEVMVSIMHAHIINMGCPGTFNTVLKDMFRRNNLPEMEFPSNPPSNEVLGATATVNMNNEFNATTFSEGRDETYYDPVEYSRLNKRKRTNNDNQETLEQTNPEENYNYLTRQQEQKGKYSTEDLALTVYSTKPNKPTSTKSLKQAIQQGTVKLTCNKNLSHKDILRYSNEDRLTFNSKSVMVIAHNELTKMPPWSLT